MNKTHDEIKKGLECCLFGKCSDCPYSPGNGRNCSNILRDDYIALHQQLEAANADLLTKVKQLEEKCHQLERERDAAVECIGRLMVILKTYPYAATNGCAYQAYCEIQEYVKDMRGVKEE